MELTKDYSKIILENLPLIDVRAPIEFNKGAFPNAVNLPILTDDERHDIGIKYKQDGNAAATAMGYDLVSGDIKEARVRAWLEFAEANPKAIVYCFRGGSRSRIAQEWMHEAGCDIPKLEDGYKAFRNFLLNIISGSWSSAKPITLGGHTGSGKTIILQKVNKAIDLEGIAHHRGSSFGRHIDPQPQQIDFENQLAYELFRHEHGPYNHLVVEDEGRNVGRCYMNKDFFAWLRSNKMVILDVTFEERIENTLQEYVVESQKTYVDRLGQTLGLAQWFDYIEGSMTRVKKRLGGDRYNEIFESFGDAYKAQLSNGEVDAHRDWIARFLRDYYDPMYSYQMGRSTRPIAFKGNADEVLDYLNQLD